MLRHRQCCETSILSPLESSPLILLLAPVQLSSTTRRIGFLRRAEMPPFSLPLFLCPLRGLLCTASRSSPPLLPSLMCPSSPFPVGSSRGASSSVRVPLCGTLKSVPFCLSPLLFLPPSVSAPLCFSHLLFLPASVLPPSFLPPTFHPPSVCPPPLIPPLSFLPVLQSQEWGQ